MSLLVAIKFHYDLGKLLCSICEGKDEGDGDTIFLIASQINHGKEWIMKDIDLSISVTKLNMMAGKEAIDGCDPKTAYSYFGVALSLLPEDHWESNYHLSLRLNFLLASAANSSGRDDAAVLILQQISEKARCLKDKLPCYFLLSESKCLKRWFLSDLSSCIVSLNILFLFSPTSTGQSEKCLRHMRFHLEPTRRDHSKFSYTRGC